MKKKVGLLIALVMLFSLSYGCSSAALDKSDETELITIQSTTYEVTTVSESISETSTTECTSTTLSATRVTVKEKVDASSNNGSSSRNNNSSNNNSGGGSSTTTTSKPVWCDEGGSKHVTPVGLGWYSSFNETKQAGLAYGGNSGSSGSWEVQECDCGKFTVYVKID